MIKFFRNIRQKLVTEGKLVNYLKYAIGEILLVVIGILIALQINNWNENRKEGKEEIKLLIALKSEFEANLLSLDSLQKHHKENENATLKLIDAAKSDYTLKELDSLYLKSVYNYNFDPSRGICNSLISSGKLGLIKNDTLKYKIAQIQDLVDDYIDDENLVREYAFSQFMPYVLSQMPYNPLRFFKGRNTNESAVHFKLFQQMVNNRQFVDHLLMISLYRIGVFEEGTNVRKEYNSILQLITHQLKSKRKPNNI